MAGPTRASGHPDYSSSSSSAFIPEIWSGRLLDKFYASTVLGEITMTEYEGEISSKGDKVIIRTVPTITIKDYEIGGGVKYEKPENPKVELPIDKAKYFAFECNSVDKLQSDIALMESWSEDAGEQMKIAIDTQVLGSIYADVDAANKGATAGKISGNVNLGVTGTPRQISKSNVLDFIVDLGQVLDEQNVPETGRFLILPAWACSLVKLSDLKDASISGDRTSILRNGRMGTIDRFTLYSSNNVKHVTDGASKVANVLAGHPKATAFAAQMTDMEDLPNPNDFGRIVRGLNVYGFKVINATLLAHGYVYK